MNLPRAVREQAERAEAAHLAILGNTAPPAPSPEPEAPPAEAPVAAPVTPEAPVVEAPTKVEAQHVEPVTDQWELKYRVLEGKYRTEVPRLAAELRDVREELRVAKSAPPAATAAVVADVATAGLTHEAVVAQYGEDFANAVASIAQAQTKKLRDEFSSKVEGIEVDSATRSRNDFLRDLTGHVRNWQQIDQDAGFTAYLDEFDAQTGRQRREFFNEADRSNNAARVASFFAAYAKGKQSVPAPAPVPVPPAPSVEHLISPDSSRHSEAPPGKRLWTANEVSQFYVEASKPVTRYTDKEITQISADIDAAIAEGRYRG